jgi:hypothetical protein
MSMKNSGIEPSINTIDSLESAKKLYSNISHYNVTQPIDMSQVISKLKANNMINAPATFIASHKNNKTFYDESGRSNTSKNETSNDDDEVNIDKIMKKKILIKKKERNDRYNLNNIIRADTMKLPIVEGEYKINDTIFQDRFKVTYMESNHGLYRQTKPNKPIQQHDGTIYKYRKSIASQKQKQRLMFDDTSTEDDERASSTQSSKQTRKTKEKVGSVSFNKEPTKSTIFQVPICVSVHDKNSTVDANESLRKSNTKQFTSKSFNIIDDSKCRPSKSYKVPINSKVEIDDAGKSFILESENSLRLRTGGDNYNKSNNNTIVYFSDAHETAQSKREKRIQDARAKIKQKKVDKKNLNKMTLIAPFETPIVLVDLKKIPNHLFHAITRQHELAPPRYHIPPINAYGNLTTVHANFNNNFVSHSSEGFKHSNGNRRKKKLDKSISIADTVADSFKFESMLSLSKRNTVESVDKKEEVNKLFNNNKK